MIWKTVILKKLLHNWNTNLLLLEDILTLNIFLVSSAAVGRYFTLNILLIITRLICFCCKIFYLEHFTHYYSCHPAAVARYFTMNILLIIHHVLCCCCKIFNLEHFTYYSSCPLLLLQDILP